MNLFFVSFGSPKSSTTYYTLVARYPAEIQIARLIVHFSPSFRLLYHYNCLFFCRLRSSLVDGLAVYVSKRHVLDNLQRKTKLILNNMNSSQLIRLNISVIYNLGNCFILVTESWI